MFTLEVLRRIRADEIAAFARHLPAGARVLEIGAGTGDQARALAARGHAVTAIDLAGSAYAGARVHPVVDYDGAHVPLPDASVDVVMSSNVLEHVADLAQLHRESARVLAPGGFCLHAMPSATWRLWTTLAGPLDLVNLALSAAAPRAAGDAAAAPHDPAPPARRLAKAVLGRVLPIPHGVARTAVGELWTFSARHWRRHFARHGFEILAVEPMGLFYTGHLLLGDRLSMAARRALARRLGSACILYKVRPPRP